jgi:hypothetical protein
MLGMIAGAQRSRAQIHWEDGNLGRVADLRVCADVHELRPSQRGTPSGGAITAAALHKDRQSQNKTRQHFA